VLQTAYRDRFSPTPPIGAVDRKGGRDETASSPYQPVAKVDRNMSALAVMVC
jgi:hypothetical protein